MESDLFLYLAQGSLLGLAAAATPGPLLAYLLTQSLAGGWRRGAPVAFAPLLSDLILVPAILFLLKQLAPFTLRLLGAAGGVFVLHTAWQLWRTWRKKQQEDLLKVRPGFTLRQAVLMNFLSPGAYVYWSTVNGPLVLRAWNQSIGYAIGFIAAFYGFFVGSMLLLVLVLHFTRQKAPQVVRGLMLSGIIILGGFGLLLIYNAIQG